MTEENAPEVQEEQQEEIEISGEFQEGDIIFECPHCSKSIAIDPRGAGLMINCPDCDARIQVPFPEEDEQLLDEEFGSDSQLDEYVEALEASQRKVREQMQALESVTKRRDYLEKLRVEHMGCLKVIKSEMGILQDAVDRIVAVLQDV